MVDIHTHFLYGLDDGAATRAEASAMLELAWREGTRVLVATPHANDRYRFDAARVRERLAELAALFPALELRSGCDFHLTFDNVRDLLEDPGKYTIAGGAHLLVELAEPVPAPATGAVLERLLSEGLRPVITHPERNAWLREREEVLADWVRAGCLVQVTAQSITGDFGRRARQACASLFAAGLVHVVASDCHDCQRRPPGLRAARGLVGQMAGSRTAERVFETNPAAIVAGWSASTPAEVRPDFSWSSLFR